MSKNLVIFRKDYRPMARRKVYDVPSFAERATGQTAMVFIFTSAFSELIGFSFDRSGSNLPESESGAKWQVALITESNARALSVFGIDGDLALRKLERCGFYVGKPGSRFPP